MNAWWWEIRGGLAYFVVVPIVAIVAMLLFHPEPWMGFLLGTVAGICGFSALVLFTIPPASAANWRLGVEGERSSAAQLEKLRELGWTAVHDRKLERANVDHVLVGPGGVFAIDSKRWTSVVTVEDGTVKREGVDQPCLSSSARRNAAAINSVIKQSTPSNVWVEAVVVFWGEFPQNFIHEDRVTYVAGETLTAWLYSRETVLKPKQIEEIASAIEHMPDGIELGQHE